MKTIRQLPIIAVSLAVALALAGCDKQDDSAVQIPPTPPPEATAPATMTPAPEATMAAIRVSFVQLGSRLDEHNKITTSGDAFAPKDSIYASVDTSGHGSAKLAAKWIYQDGQTVHEDSKMLDTSGRESTVFMISKPSGFSAGNYKVAISLNGEQVASKDFSIR